MLVLLVLLTLLPLLLLLAVLCAGLFEHIKHLAFGPDFLILRSSEEDAAFREKTDHCRDPSTDKAPVRGGAALADAGTVQVEVTMAQDGSKSKAKASGTSTTRLHAWIVCAGLCMLRPEGLRGVMLTPSWCMPALQHPPSLHKHPCAVHVLCLSVHVLCLQQESKEKAAEQKIVYAVPCDDPIGPAVKQEFKTRKVYNKVDELSLLPFTPPSMVSYATSMLAGTFKVTTTPHSQCAGASRQSVLRRIVLCCALVHRAPSSDEHSRQRIACTVCARTPARSFAPAACTNFTAFNRCFSTW